MIFQKPNRELSVTEIFSQSLSLYSAKFVYFFAPFLLVNIANSGLRRLMGYYIPPFNPPQGFTEQFLMWIANYATVVIGVASVFIVIEWIISTVANGIAVKYSSDLLNREHAKFREGVNFALSRSPSLVAAGFITGVLTVLGLILFIIPGFVVTIMFSLIVPAIMIERLSISESLRRSKGLVANRWRKTFAILFLIFLAIILANLIGETIRDIVGTSLPPLNEAIIVIVTSLAQPLQPIALSYLYYSLLAREKPTERLPQLQHAGPIVSPPIYPYPQTSTTFQPRFCYRCGQKLPSDAIFCPQCGKQVKADNIP